MEIGVVLLVSQRFLNVQLVDDGIAPIAMGGDFLGFSPILIVLQAALALAFLVVAVFAWRGRPPSIRIGMVLAVTIVTLIRFALLVLPNLTPANIANGIDSGTSLWDGLGIGQFLSGIPILVYVLWYMNRGPARAFYRGTFLPEGKVN